MSGKDTAKKKVRLYSEISFTLAESETRRRKNALEREKRENSFEYQLSQEKRIAIQPLYSLEKQWKKACEAKIKDKQLIEDYRTNILRGLDRASIDSINSLLNEIIYTYLNNKKIKYSDIKNFEITKEIFFTDFEKFYKTNFDKYIITEEEFNNIIGYYIDITYNRLKTLGNEVGYIDPADLLYKNIKIIEKYSIVKNTFNI